ncbi:MAG: hypothetical protein WD049_10390 [Candidatus Paceibacterota bacterium]
MVPSKTFLIVVGVIAGLGALVILSTFISTGGSLTYFSGDTQLGEQDRAGGTANRIGTSGESYRPFDPDASGEDATLTVQFREYLSASTNNASVSDADAAVAADNTQLVRDFLAQHDIAAYLQRYNKTTRDDLTITASGDIQTYGTRVLGAFINADPETIGTELVLYQRARETDDAVERERLLTELAVIHQRYERIRQNLVQVPTPEQAVEAHLKLVNSVALMVKRTEGMAAMEADPIRAVVDAGAYPVFADTFVDAYEEMMAYLEASGVRFAQS